MTEELWVSMPIIQNIVLGTGCNPHIIEMICREGNISPEQLGNAELKLSLAQNCAIMEASLNFSGDTNLGLHVGEKTTPVVLGITGHLMQSSKNVLTALGNLQKFTSVFTRLYNFYMEVKEKEVFYYCEPIQVWNDISPETARQSVDIAYAGALHIIQLLTGKFYKPKRVLYRYSKVSDMTEYQRVLKCNPEFNQNRNCIVFSLSDLLSPVIGYNQELNQLFTKLLEDQIKEQDKLTTFSSTVKQIILKKFEFNFPSLETIAESLNMTPRTLQRKLKDEATSYRLLLESLKEELARNLLRDKRQTVAQISYKLGYAEPSAFQRAFRQWTGLSPTEFRIKNGVS